MLKYVLLFTSVRVIGMFRFRWFMYWRSHLDLPKQFTTTNVYTNFTPFFVVFEICGVFFTLHGLSGADVN